MASNDASVQSNLQAICTLFQAAISVSAFRNEMIQWSLMREMFFRAAERRVIVVVLVSAKLQIMNCFSKIVISLRLSSSLSLKE